MTDPTALLVDFSEGDPPRFEPVDDQVMGGRSLSRVRQTGQGTAVFEGVLSLERGGGFASARAGIPNTDLTGASGVRLRVRGDGRHYRLSFRNSRRLTGIHYAQAFPTTAGEWEEVCLPFDGFEPSLQGRRPADPPPLDPARIRQVGFLLSDGTEGPFRLEVEWIRGWAGSD